LFFDYSKLTGRVVVVVIVIDVDVGVGFCVVVVDIVEAGLVKTIDDAEAILSMAVTVLNVTLRRELC
jgi:hypothetical protein